MSVVAAILIERDDLTREELGDRTIKRITTGPAEARGGGHVQCKGRRPAASPPHHRCAIPERSRSLRSAVLLVQRGACWCLNRVVSKRGHDRELKSRTGRPRARRFRGAPDASSRSSRAWRPRPCSGCRAPEHRTTGPSQAPAHGLSPNTSKLLRKRDSCKPSPRCSHPRAGSPRAATQPMTEHGPLQGGRHTRDPPCWQWQTCVACDEQAFTPSGLPPLSQLRFSLSGKPP